MTSPFPTPPQSQTSTPLRMLAPVVSACRLAGDHCRLVLEAPEVAKAARPGQFVHLACPTPPAVREFEQHKNRPLADWDAAEGTVNFPLLRRPISIHRICRPARVDLLFKIVGEGTLQLAKRGPGDLVDLIGPLGNGFDLDGCGSLVPEAIPGPSPGGPGYRAASTALLVAGGIGIAPLFALAEELRGRGARVVAVVGVLDERRFPFAADSEVDFSFRDGRPSIRELEEIGVETRLVSERREGILVTEYLERNLDRLLGPGGQVFACGPRPMLARIAGILAGRPCQVLLEERMACGVGACRSCVIRVRADNPAGWEYRTVCRDGPVFRAQEVIWE